LQIEKVFRCYVFELNAKEDIIINWREALLLKLFRLVYGTAIIQIIRFRSSFSTYSFTDYFKGFEKVEAVKRIFGEKTEETLRNLRVEFMPLVGYMGVNVRMDISWSTLTI